MKPSNMGHRIVATALLATLAVSAVAPAAFAGNRGHGNGYGHGKHGGYNGVRYKGGPYRRPVVVREVEVVHHYHGSDWTPAIVGFIGGVAVGAILSDRAEPQPVYQSSYVYEDPYCHERFSSLDAYQVHTRSRGCDHWAVARVIDRRSGACTQTLCWRDGGWHQTNNDWNNWRAEGRYHDNGDWERD